MKYLIMFFCILLLASCRSYDIPQANKTHPANSQAKSSGEIEQIQTLNVDEDDLPKPPGEMKNQKIKHM
jgi:hypothetical protein